MVLGLKDDTQKFHGTICNGVIAELPHEFWVLAQMLLRIGTLESSAQC